MDKIVCDLHLQNKKCVFFVADHYILKAAENVGQKYLRDYKFLGGNSTEIQVFGAIGVDDKVALLHESNEGEFLVYRRGLYIYGADPWKLLKR